MNTTTNGNPNECTFCHADIEPLAPTVEKNGRRAHRECYDSLAPAVS